MRTSGCDWQPVGTPEQHQGIQFTRKQKVTVLEGPPHIYHSFRKHKFHGEGSVFSLHLQPPAILDRYVCIAFYK